MRCSSYIIFKFFFFFFGKKKEIFFFFFFKLSSGKHLIDKRKEYKMSLGFYRPLHAGLQICQTNTYALATLQLERH